MIETVFYTLGIIAMSIFLTIVILLVAFIIRLRSSIVSFKTGFAGKIMGVLKERNVEVASALGLTLAHFVMDRMRHVFEEKKSKRN